MKNTDGNKLRSTDLFPLPKYSGDEIRAIRLKSKMCQECFAAYFGLSKRTIAAWETGLKEPSGPSRRLLSILEAEASLKK